MKKYQQLFGFTITELLIVISVIGIVASIAIVLYPGYQLRTLNNERKSDVQQIAAALGTYAIQNNNYVGTGSGCGLGGNGNGWVAVDSGQIGTYASKSILKCLQDAGVLTSSTSFIDPSGCLWASGGACGLVNGKVKAYMKVSCLKGGSKVNYVFAYLESEPQKVAEVDGLCDSNTVSGFDAITQKWGTSYGMNYYVQAK